MLNVKILQPDDWILSLISATELFPQKESLFHITHVSPPRCIHDGERLDCGRRRRWDFVDQLRKVFLDPLGIPFFLG